MSELYTESTDFESWYYNNDPTHVFFYYQDSLDWLRDNLGFSSLEISGRLIVFKVYDFHEAANPKSAN